MCIWNWFKNLLISIIHYFKGPPVTGRYGWKRQALDPRDFRYVATAAAENLPSMMDLRPQMPPIYDQKNLGSCTANAVGGMLEHEQIQGKIAPYLPSRLFTYYNTRYLEGTTRTDSGASLRDTIKAVVRWGFCDETLWPYNIAKFAYSPSKSAYRAAAKNKLTAVSYLAVSQNLHDLKTCLAEGNCVIFGFSVYDSFESDAVANSGNVPIPAATESLLGGHAVGLVGFDDVKRQFIVRNSWGEGWGLKGYCMMPYDFIVNPKFASDFWCIKTIPGAMA